MQECQRRESVWVGNVRCFPASASECRRENQPAGSWESTCFSSLLPPNRYCAALRELTFCAHEPGFYSSLRASVSAWLLSHCLPFSSVLRSEVCSSLFGLSHHLHGNNSVSLFNLKIFIITNTLNKCFT